MPDSHPNRPVDDTGQAAEVTFISLVQSVCAAAFGVQSEKNRRRDFESGKFWHFVAAGLVFVAVFMALVWAAVKYLVATSG